MPLPTVVLVQLLNRLNNYPKNRFIHQHAFTYPIGKALVSPGF